MGHVTVERVLLDTVVMESRVSTWARVTSAMEAAAWLPHVWKWLALSAASVLQDTRVQEWVQWDVCQVDLLLAKEVLWPPLLPPAVVAGS